MKLAAALILTLASSAALADQPMGFTATDDLWHFGGRTSATQPQQQPYSDFQGPTSWTIDMTPPVTQYQDGDSWGVAPAENRYDVHTYSFDGKGNDVVTEEITL